MATLATQFGMSPTRTANIGANAPLLSIKLIIESSPMKYIIRPKIILNPKILLILKFNDFET